MPEKAKVPAIRFKGFTDAWEQRKLGDHCEMHNGDRGINYPNDKDMVSDGIPFINAGDLKNGRVNLITSNKITREKYNQLGGAKLQLGDIVYCLRGTLGKNAFIDNFDEGTVASSLVALRPKNIDNKYLFHILNSSIEFRQRTVCDEGAAQPNLSAKNLGGFDIPVPKFEEQKQISIFLDNLDNLITLHQRKLLKLKNVKKAMLEKMFPKNGSNVPEIRFAGFTDAWEQRKLKEIADKVTEKNAKLQFTETFTNSAEFGIISQRDYFDHDISNEDNLGSYYVVRNEDFIYNPRISTFAPVGPINRNKLGRNGVMSPLYTVFRTHDINNTFLEQYFRSIYWHSFMKLNGDSGARSDRFSIKDSVLIEMPIPYPGLKEQLKIGEYLTKLDNLITLHQRKYEKLQNLKKACLEKMFV